MRHPYHCAYPHHVALQSSERPMGRPRFTGARGVAACFRQGRYRYIDADGTLMAIEVPPEQYDTALRAMERKIVHGNVPGLEDPRRSRSTHQERDRHLPTGRQRRQDRSRRAARLARRGWYGTRTPLPASPPPATAHSVATGPKRTAPAGCTDSSRQPACRHSPDAGYASQPAPSVHQSRAPAASGRPLPSNSRIGSNGMTQSA